MKMDAETITLLFKAIVPLISVLLTAFVIPWLKGKIGADKFAKLEEYTELAVRTAEQVFSNEEWSEKKEYVLKYISAKVTELGIDMSAEDIDNLIEGTVNEVKHFLQ